MKTSKKARTTNSTHPNWRSEISEQWLNQALCPPVGGLRNRHLRVAAKR